MAGFEWHTGEVDPGALPKFADFRQPLCHRFGLR